MRILWVTNMWGGVNPSEPSAGIFVTEQVDGLKKKSDINGDVYVIHGYRSKWYYLMSILLINIKLLFTKYDVIHCHYGISALFLLFNPFVSRRKVVLTLHGGDIQIEQGKNIQVAITRKIIKHAGTVICLNDRMLDECSNLNDNCVVIPCGVDENLFNYDGKERARTIVFGGSPGRWVKNFPLFVKVLAEFKEISGEELKYVVLDNKSRVEVAELLKQSSCLLLTSHSEGSPQVVKEAIACGTPVVTTPVGDVASYLNKYSNILVSSSFCEKELAVLLMKALSNPVIEPPSKEVKELIINSYVFNRLYQIYGKVLQDYS
ncbi:MAG: glycosyltransferase family 4 protein [Motiliproteus sp.]